MEKCVSVVIPSYNRAHLLKQTIPSYIQEYVGEVIIVDDCSVDNTIEVVRQLQEEYPLISYIRMERNSKQTAAKNRGIENAKYPYIYLGDDDSLLVKGSISELLETMEAYDADVVGAKALYMDTEDDMKNIEKFILEKSRSITSIPEELDINRLFFINFDFDCIKVEEVPFCHACALIKKEVFDTIKFDISYGGNAFREETDFFTRVNAAGKHIYYDSKAIQINLPRKMIIEKKSFIKYKLRASLYEFINTYKYLHKNIEFIQQYYHISKSFQAIWLKYMKDALSVKLIKLGKLLRGAK